MVEDGGNLWIHLDGALILAALLMSLVDDAIDPFLEGLTHFGVDDVGDVSSRERNPFSFKHRERPHHVRSTGSEL